MSKRSRGDEEEVPNRARSAARLKREDHPDADETSLITVVPDDSAPTAAENVALEAIPKLTKVARLVLEGLSSQDLDTACDAASRLRNLIGADDAHAKKNRQLAHRCGAHLAAMQVMRKWKNHEKIHRVCLCLIANLFANTEVTSPILLLGGMEMIVSDLRLFPDSKGLQRAGFLALANILTVPRAGAFNKRFVQELNGVSVLVNAMEKFPNDGMIQQLGCTVFGVLAAIDAELKPTIIEQKAGTAAAEAYRNSKDMADDADEVRKWAKRCMDTLYE